MYKKILWVEDESFMINGLLRPMEKIGYTVEVAKTALEGYRMAAEWSKYDLLIVDLIIPITYDEKTVPDEVRQWENEPYVGVGLAKWLMKDLKVKIPIILLSVVSNPIASFELNKYGLKYFLPKSGLLPSKVKEEILSILEVE